MSYARYGVPQPEPGLTPASRIFQALGGEPSGSATLAITIGHTTSGSASAIPKVNRARVPFDYPQPETRSRMFHELTNTVASDPTGSATLPIVVTHTTSGTASAIPKVARAKEPFDYESRELQSRLYRVIRPATGSSTLPITVSHTTSGSSVGLAGVVEGRTPFDYPIPEPTSRLFRAPAPASGSATFPITIGITSNGFSGSPPQIPPRAHRAKEPFDYPQPEPVSRIFQALTHWINGSASLPITIGISTAGSVSGAATPRLGVAIQGSTNQGFSTRAPSNPGPETIPLESRSFVYYHAAPPIYRPIVPGSTNQHYTAVPLKQPPVEQFPPSRIYTIRVTGAASGSSTLPIVIGHTTSGLSSSQPKVVRAKPIEERAEPESRSRLFHELTTPDVITGSSTLPITIGFTTAGAPPASPIRLSVITQGSTNQFAGTPTPPKDPPEVFRPTRWYPAKRYSPPPIYRVILQGGTNQGLGLFPVRQPVLEVFRPPTRVTVPPPGEYAVVVTTPGEGPETTVTWADLLRESKDPGDPDVITGADRWSGAG